MVTNRHKQPALRGKLLELASRCYLFAREQRFAPLVCAGLMAVPVATAFGFVAEEGFGVPGLSELLLCLGLWLFFYVIFLAFLSLFTYQKNKRLSADNGRRRQTKMGSKKAGGEQLAPAMAKPNKKQAATAPPPDKLNLKRIFSRWAILLLCWLPMLIAMYPGIAYNDTNFQLSQYMGNPMLGVFGMQDGTVLSDHQPIFDTFVFGFIVNIGYQISGQYSCGLFLLVAVQALATSFTFSFSCNYLERIGAGKLATRVVFLVFCFFPLYSWIVTLVAKDTFFSWIYVWFIILIFEFIRSDAAVFKRLPLAIAFCLVCLLLALTKKTGLYLVVISCLILLIVYRKSILVFLGSVIVPVAVMLLVLPLIVFPALKVSPGSPIEVLGFFYQQTARYVIDNPDDVTSEEQQIIDQMIGYKTIPDRYNPIFIDPLKGFGYLDGVETWPSQQQIQQYFQIYLDQGARHLESYLKALGSLEAGWFYPWSYGDGAVFELAEQQFDGHKIGSQQAMVFERPAAIAQVTTEVVKFEKGLAQFPVIRVLYTPSLFIMFIPLLASLLSWKGDRRYLGIMVPVWSSFLILLISPANGPSYEALRYVMPFIYTAPLLIALAIVSFLQDWQQSPLRHRS